MSDYISREALTEAFENADADVCESFPDGYCDWGFGRQTIRDVIASVPTADVEPVRHGWWDVNRRCSECGNPAPLAYSKPDRWKSPYCPNCGSKMDLEDENNENFSK